MCGDVLRGTHPDGQWMRFPAPYLLSKEKKEQFHKDWYYPVYFKYEEYTVAQLNPWVRTEIDFPVVNRDLRYKKTFFLILDTQKLASYNIVKKNEEKRRRWLTDRNISFLRSPYITMSNLRPYDCFLTWEKWVDYLLQFAGQDAPQIVIRPPLCCHCH